MNTHQKCNLSYTKKSLRITGLIVLFLCLVNQRITAQFLIGPKAGARMTWQTYESFNNDEYKRTPHFSFATGVSTIFQVRKRFILQVDILYSRQGKVIKGIVDPTLKNSAVYHYINTPAIYKFDFKQSLWGRRFKWYVGAGPNVNFWLSGNGKLSAVELLEIDIDQMEYDIEFTSYPDNPEENKLYVEEPNRVQVGLVLSTGLSVDPVPGQTLLIDFRFDYGHSYMSRSSGIFSDVIAYEDNLRARNHGIQVSVSYMFNFITKGKKERRMYYEKLD